jgi:hypothetical protein
MYLIIYRKNWHQKRMYIYARRAHTDYLYWSIVHYDEISDAVFDDSLIPLWLVEISRELIMEL